MAGNYFGLVVNLWLSAKLLEADWQALLFGGL
jgi:hypothetical protein